MISGRCLRSLRSVRAAATILAVVAVTVLAPATARADLLDATCASSSTVTYNPPLTRTPQDVTVGATVLYGPCVSATVPGLTSGVTVASLLAPGP